MCRSPTQYIKVSHVKEHALRFFKQYSKLFNWSKWSDFKMLDVGSGPGNLLMEIENIIPQNYSEIVAIDNSKAMVDYFRPQLKDPRILSRQVDIEMPQLPSDLKERFHFTFSSYCFQYVKDIRTSLKNCQQTLRTEGEFFTIFSRRSHIYENYKALSEIPKWAPYVSDFKTWRNHFDSNDPVGNLEKLADEAGFDIIQAEEATDLEYYEEDPRGFLDLYDSMDMVAQRIPQIDLPEYKKDYHKLCLAMVMFDETRERGMKAKLPCPSLVLAARTK